MYDPNISKLLDEIDRVHYQEFWWGSQLLQKCAESKDVRVVEALLIRHHCLGNKKADSAHVIRNTIKLIEGEEFHTLWSLIDRETDTNHLIGTIDDPLSKPWAAAYVLGEIGGAPALNNVTGRLTPNHATRHFLTAKLAFHLIVRYIQIENLSEPTVTEIDAQTGITTEIATKTRYPDKYQRQMLRREQENEYFVPVKRYMLLYLKSHLSKIPDNFIPLSKQEIFAYIDRIPIIEDRITMTMMNQKGEITGSVTRLEDGHHVLSATDKSDVPSLLIALFLVFAENVPPKDKITFSKWAGLPTNTWTQSHRETFSIVLYHYFLEIKKQGGGLPPKLVNVTSLFEEKAVPPIKKALTPEVRDVFKRLFT
jgi:hypothetical protein